MGIFGKTDNEINLSNQIKALQDSVELQRRKTAEAEASLEKKEQEIASLKRIPDSFSKTVVVRDYLKPWQDENGIVYLGIEQFLLDEDILK